jgi:hypothetical protein
LAGSQREPTLFAAKTNPIIILNPGAKATWQLKDPALSSIVGVFTNNLVHLDALWTSLSFGEKLEGTNPFRCQNK